MRTGASTWKWSTVRGNGSRTGSRTCCRKGRSGKTKQIAETSLVEIKTLKDQLEAERANLQEEIKLEYNHEQIIGLNRSTLRACMRKLDIQKP